MLNKIKHVFDWVERNWKEHGFEILLVLTIIIIVILAITRLGKSGTWAKDVIYPDSLKTDSRAPKSSKPSPIESKGEAECRRVLETHFGRPFPKARPNMLRNPIGTDSNLELDCYNDELKIACEYQGIQHYKYVPYFHKTKDAFQNQKYRDHIKKEVCIKNGIKLIEVPYSIKIENIKEYILNKL